MPTPTEPSTTTTLSRDEFLRHKVVELFTIRQQLLEHPDPARITEWLSPQCSCWDIEMRIVDVLASGGHHLQGADADLLAVALEEDHPAVPALTAVWRRNAVKVVDGSGSVVRERPASEPRGIGIDIAVDEAGRWTVVSLIELQLAPELIQELLEVGLP